MTLNEQQALFALNVAKLIAYINEHGFSCTFGEAYRTPEQAAIYAKEGKGILHSLHCERLAIDLNLFSGTRKLRLYHDGHYLADSHAYEPFGIYFETLNPLNKWGGHFHDISGRSKPDGNHFEMDKE